MNARRSGSPVISRCITPRPLQCPASFDVRPNGLLAQDEARWGYAVRKTLILSKRAMRARRRTQGIDAVGITLRRHLGLALGLGELAQDDAALEGRNVVDEQRALEVIHLVLDHGREQARGMEL